MNEFNPYAAPTADIYKPHPFQAPQPVVPAGQGARFLNFLIDQAVLTALGFGFFFAIVLVGGEGALRSLEGVPGIIFNVTFSLVYYIGLESTTSVTLGKLVTGTMVVNERGEPPTFGQIVGRSFCRFIPFEPLSCLGTRPRGWHDSIPKTYVVRSR